MKYLLILVTALVLLLTGCATHIQTPSVPSLPNEALLQQCPPLKELPFNNMGDAVTAVLEYINQYNECATVHNSLVEYERKRK